MSNENTLWSFVEAKRDGYCRLADSVWETPELLYEEHRSAAAHREMLEAEGFRVTDGLAGIETAVMGEAGEGGPVIAILGEYDALPGLSQEAGVDYPAPLEKGGSGHGCGHNLLGAGALLAATAVKDWLAANNLPGRVRYYGCPAEEGGAAKTFMVRDGLFKDVDAALSWHPMSFNGIIPPLTLAVAMVDFHFKGRTSHAAVSPHLGRSALDAVELMSVGVNYLREHVPQDSRIHYAVTDSGGIAPNVVQERATVRYSVRSLKRKDMQALVDRVTNVAKGAAMMTDTQVEVDFISAMSEMLDNPPLYKLLQRHMEAAGAARFDAADRDYARRIQATLTEADIEAVYQASGVEPQDTPICDFVVPYETRGVPMLGSTDLGDVSWAVPFAQLGGGTMAIGTPLHTWQTTAQGKTPAAHKAMVQISKALAGAAAELLTTPAVLEAARADFEARTGKTPYESPLTPDARPRAA
ncbi:amidohydrolase [Mameliella sediminis]|uniref:amidohydrolase n=1 Tax=Mameliella sediminis TaxID=2836866 RepID=UPI001C46942B|nr:amidohydrolase [Mameliella sediminis]MBV7397277.1 amidohydrolase [Mameliella sediminis]MBY6146855.1 amidohydrolase [Mameliella alba]MCA0956741.1 amidohydrolase [Mameliella alba]